MDKLRWILLAGGAALVLALLIVGLVRGRQAARAGERRVQRRGDDPALGDLPEVDHHVLPSAGMGLARADDNEPDLPPPAGDAANGGSATFAAPVATDADDAAVEHPSIAEWPPAEQRQIVSLRIVPLGHERLSGRRLRQGLQSAGFLHGELAIFHLPGRADRAMLSAANLTQPGQLDPALMDYQRFAGVHVFTVLPGRVAPTLALEQLYAVTAEVARRVDGRVQDGASHDLDPTQVDDWLDRQLGQVVPGPAATGAAAAG